MKLFSSFAHGVLDYLTGAALIAAPNLFGFAHIDGPAESLPRILGVLILLQALMTNYELGVFRAISMKTHLMLDLGLGLFLAASPWIFDFRTQPTNVWMPHVVVGLAIVAISFLTDPVPGRSTTAAPRHA